VGVRGTTHDGHVVAGRGPRGAGLRSHARRLAGGQRGRRRLERRRLVGQLLLEGSRLRRLRREAVDGQSAQDHGAGPHRGGGGARRGGVLRGRRAQGDVGVSQLPDLVHHTWTTKRGDEAFNSSTGLSGRTGLTFSCEVSAENVGQFLHQDVSHLEGAHDDAQILRGHHASDVARNYLVLQHVLQTERFVQIKRMLH